MNINEHEDIETPSRTRIVFDLKDILTAEELEQFLRSAEEAHAPNLREHFLNITLRTKQAA